MTKRLRLAAATCTLLALAPAAARAQTARRSTAAPSQKPSFAPAPPAEPAPAVAPAVATGTEPVSASLPWRAAASFGFEFGLEDTSYTSPKLQIALQRPIQPLTPQVQLDLVVALGLLHAQGSESVALPPFGSANVKWGLNLFEVVPAARFSIRASPQLMLYGDAGLGAAYSKGTGSVTIDTGFNTIKVEPVSSGMAGVVRVAGGLVFSVGQHVRIGAEAPLSLRFGSGVGSSLALLFTASHTL
jgi:hypothetical protein